MNICGENRHLRQAAERCTQLIELMKKEEKRIEYLKYLPLLTIIVYASGFIVYNTHLARFGIVEQNILNIRFISSGSLYCLFIALFFGPIYYINNTVRIKKKNLLIRGIISIFVSGAMFFFFALFLYENVWNYHTLLFLGIFTFLALIFFWFVKELEEEKFKWRNIPMYIFSLGIGSMMAFGLNLEHISNSFGGAFPYKNVLIVNEKVKSFMATNNLNKTDTLRIIHENIYDIFILNNDNIQTLKQEDIISRIIIKE